MQPDASTPILDDKYRGLIQDPVSINVAACDAGNVPAVTRAYGCAVSADGRRVTVFVAEAASTEVLACIGQNGNIAVVCSHPGTHRTLQMKGNDAHVAQPALDDVDHVDHWRNTFAAMLEANGYPPRFIQSLVSATRQPLKAIRFTLASVYDQSPGPGAGRRVGG